MKAKEIRAQAREALSGNWATFILLNVMYVLSIAVLSFLNVLIPIIGYIALMVLTVPLAYGYLKNLLRLKRKETDNAFEFFRYTFNDFARAWCVTGRILLKLIVPLIIVGISLIAIVILAVFVTMSAIAGNESALVVSSFGYLIVMVALFIGYIWLIVRGLLCVLSTYIAIDNPQMSAKETVDLSVKLMKGNRLKYIFLSLSFIGWMILSILTLGIGFIFLFPYMSVAMVCFYENLAGKTKSSPISSESGKIEIVQKPEQIVDNVSNVSTEQHINDVNENNNPIK